MGRTFHSHQTLPALSEVLTALAAVVARERVDVVVVAGDVFDTAVPSPDAHRVLAAALAQVQSAGAKIVLSSGNHDSAARLGFLAPFTQAGGLHIHTRPDRIEVPTVLPDAFGQVKFFGIPYLEPALIRHLPAAAEVRNQADAMAWAANQIKAATEPGDRTVVLAHTFAATGTATEVAEAVAAPRDFTRGGVDAAPAELFADFSYVALGHLHGRSRLADHIRYSGAPLHYSFGEANKPRGAWLVELGPAGFAAADWIDLPVPRKLIEIRGTLANLLANPDFGKYEEHWVRAVLTDNTRVIDPVRKLRQRFPFTVDLAFAPEQVVADNRKYRDRVRSSAGRILHDEDIVDSFAASVRNGESLTAAEQEILVEIIAAVRVERGLR